MPNKRILILDDHTDVAQTIQWMAESLGLEAQFVTNPEEFFEKLSTSRPDFITLDLVMPGLDGVEIMRLLAERKCRAKIIISSGMGSRVLEAAQRSAAQHGLDIVGVLSKPISKGALHFLVGEGSERRPPAIVESNSAIPEESGARKADLESALERDEFFVMYQPKIGCRNSRPARYGGKSPEFGTYRVFAEGFHYDSLPALNGLDGKDDWRLVHSGFRVDTSLSAEDSMTTEGEAYQGAAGEMATAPMSLIPPETETISLRDVYSGWNLLSKWTHTISPQSQTSLQVYFDRTNRGDTTYALGVNTFDIDFQHHVAVGTRQDVVWGLGYRFNPDHTSPTLRIVFTPQNRNSQLFSTFVQDEFTVRPERLHVSLGARVEHNDYTGFDFQPSSRMTWTPDDKNMIWGAISGADRTPSLSDTSIRVNYAALPGPGNMPTLVSLFGDPDFKNEHLTAFEVGNRNSWTSTLSIDSTVFYNRYRDLVSVEPGAPRPETNPGPPHLLVPSYFSNGLHGETHGLELFANWKAASFWTLSPGYSFFSMHLHPFAGSQDFTDAAGTEGGTPDHQAQLRSGVTLPHNLEWNASAYFVNRLPAVSIPSYTRVDTDLIWNAGERVSLSVVGQNLAKSVHPEYAGPSSTEQTDLIRRSAYAKVVWSF
ncbi:MAG: TonB-dependent receptor [Terracidiphilus sp.]|jgi:iron complex outermembrane receptor protein